MLDRIKHEIGLNGGTCKDNGAYNDYLSNSNSILTPAVLGVPIRTWTRSAIANDAGGTVSVA